MGLDFRESLFQFLLGVFPGEGFGDLVEQLLKLEYGPFQGVEVGKIVWGQDLTLEYREEYLYLVEPTGVHGSMDLYGVRVPLRKALYRGFPAMRGAVIRDPEDSACRAIRLLLHHQIHKLVKGLYSCCFLADSEELGSVDIPGSKIGQSTLSFVFKLNKPLPARQRTDTDELSMSGLNAGLFIRADHVVMRSQGGSFEPSEIEVQDTSGLFCEERVAWKQPTPIQPRLYCVAFEVAPDSGDADGDYNAPNHRLSGDIAGTEARKGEAQSAGEFTGESLDFHNALRGKKSAVFRTLVGLPDPPSVCNRSASST
jgi:hypothetical protein